MGGRRAQTAGLFHFCPASCTEGVHSSLEPFITVRTSPKCRIPGQRHLFLGSPTSLSFVSKLTYILHHFNLFPVASHTFPSLARCCQNCCDAGIVTLLMLQQGDCGSASAWSATASPKDSYHMNVSHSSGDHSGEVKGNCRYTPSAMLITGTKQQILPEMLYSSFIQERNLKLFNSNTEKWREKRKKAYFNF